MLQSVMDKQSPLIKMENYLMAEKMLVKHADKCRSAIVSKAATNRGKDFVAY